jgi:hypothetical protein
MMISIGQVSPKHKAVYSMPIQNLNWDNLPPLLNEKETAKLLNVSVSFLRKGRSEGARKGRTIAPPHVKIARRVRYKTSVLKEWVDALTDQDHI